MRLIEQSAVKELRVEAIKAAASTINSFYILTARIGYRTSPPPRHTVSTVSYVVLSESIKIFRAYFLAPQLKRGILHVLVRRRILRNVVRVPPKTWRRQQEPTNQTCSKL
jgi:hypothetical protein